MLKKKLSTPYAKLSFFIFVGLMLVSFPAIARADAVFVSSARFSVFAAGFRTASGTSLATAPSALTITSQVLFQTPSHTETGNASTTLNATNQTFLLGPGHLRFITFVRGDAGSPSGFASGSWQTAGTIVVQNSSSTEGFFVDYTWSIAFGLSAQFDPALNESANAALAFIIATSPENVVVNFSRQQVVPGGTDRDEDFFSGTFSIFVPAGESRGLGAGSGVGGSAQVVPEPTTMLLLGTGLAGVAIKTRKRFKSRKKAQASQ
jgi:hypothetical protein